MKNNTIILLLLVCYALHGQRNMNGFYTLTADDGLAHNEVKFTIKDSLGFIWIGTSTGLQRYDGYEFKTYKNPHSNSIQHTRDINSAYLKDNKLWLYNPYQISVFDLKREQFLPINANFKLDGAKADLREKKLMVDGKNRLWIRLNNKPKVCSISRKNDTIFLKTIEHQLNLPNNLENIGGFETDNDVNVWLGTKNGIHQATYLDSGRVHWKFFQNPHSNIIQYDKAQKILWVSSFKFIRYFNVDYHFLQPTHLRYNPHINVGAIYNDHLKIIDASHVRNNEIWLALSNQGLVNVTKAQSAKPEFVLYNTQGISFRRGIKSISNLYNDKHGYLWISSWNEGLAIYNSNHKQFRTYQVYESYKNTDFGLASIKSIVVDNNGKWWMHSANNNIFTYYNGKCKQLNGIPGLKQAFTDEISHINTDKIGNIYISCNNGTYIHNINTKTTRYYPIGSKIPERILHLVVDKNNVVWAIKTGLGLVRISFNPPNETQTLFTDTGVTGNTLTSISFGKIDYNSKLHELYITTNKGFNRVLLNNQSQVKEIIKYTSPNNNGRYQFIDLWDFTQDTDTSFWIASLGNGLFRLNYPANTNTQNTSIKCFTTEHGLPNNHIHSVLHDRNGHVWITSRGLSHFNPVTGNFHNFDVGDGLQSNSFNTIARTKLSNGKLVFCGLNGINTFYPDSIHLNTQKPNIVFTNLIVNGSSVVPGKVYKDNVVLKQSISHTSTIELNHQQNNFTIEFAGLNYANPNKHNYKYRLLGYQNNWVSTNSANRKANFSNLKYGNYTLQVLATNNDQIWNRTPAQINITIVPPWWWSTWSKISYLVILLMIIGSVYYFQSVYYKTKHQLKIKLLNESKNEELLQTKLRFFTNISHEFKTPLSLILLPVDRLLSGDIVGDVEKNNLYRAIKSNARRLLHLVNELMEFRRIETGKSALKLQPLEINKFIDDIALSFKSLMENKYIDFTYTIPTNEHYIYADADKLAKIFTNLISNAYKYTSEKGKVALVVSDTYCVEEASYSHSIKIEAQKNNKYKLFIIVRDTGIGISQHTIGQIFERFYQVEESDQEKHLGSGIGLALTKNLVLAHYGVIMVSSERNKGSEFVVGLPTDKAFYEKLPNVNFNSVAGITQTSQIANDLLEASTSVYTNTKNIQQLNTKTNTLLIAEDNDQLRKFLHESFEQHYNVISVTNGKEAINVIGNKLIDLIITDVMMPVMDGFELTRKVKRDINYCHIPIVMLTAKSEYDDKDIGAEAGAEAYISKPFSYKFLQHTVHNIITSRYNLKQKFSSNASTNTKELTSNSADKQFIDKIISIVERNLPNPGFKMNDLYLEMGMSRTPLFNKIKHLTGQSPSELVRTIRLKKAAQLLLTQPVDINQISTDVGFKYQSHFTKAFKEQFSCTPTEYAAKSSNLH